MHPGLHGPFPPEGLQGLGGPPIVLGPQTWVLGLQGLQHPGLQGPQAPGPQGPGPQGPPPGLLQGPQELPGPKKLTRPDFGGFAGGSLPQGPHPQICSSQGPGPLQRASWKRPENVATAEGFCPWVWGIPFKGKINVHCIYLAHWGGWRQGCASRCTGRAWRGSIRPLSIGSSHCLTQYGGKG